MLLSALEQISGQALVKINPSPFHSSAASAALEVDALKATSAADAAAKQIVE